jgi:hypothetical protein
MLTRIPTLTIVAAVAVIVGAISQLFPLTVLGVIALVVSVVRWVTASRAGAV